MIRLQELSDAVARAVGGEVRLVPDDPPHACAVALPAGPMPILVREYPGSSAVVVGDQVWAIAGEVAGVLPEVSEAAGRWVAEHPGEATMIEVALTLAAALSAALGDRWTVNIPSPDRPGEMWLHGAVRDMGAVGVFPGRLVLWTEEGEHEIPVAARADLAAASAAALAVVHRQRQAYQRNVQLSAGVAALAEQLLAALPARLPRARDWRTSSRYKASHLGALQAELTCVRPDGLTQRAVHIQAEGGVIRAHAGLPAPEGWEGTLTSINDQLPSLVQAIAVAHATMTVEQLQRGRRYRVLQPIRQLSAGEVVTYQGFDDVDNHYGRYLFAGPDGRELVVDGDCSTPSNGPLGAVHRYLAPLD
jgi:hypothetical protein